MDSFACAVSVWAHVLDAFMATTEHVGEGRSPRIPGHITHELTLDTVRDQIC